MRDFGTILGLVEHFGVVEHRVVGDFDATGDCDGVGAGLVTGLQGHGNLVRRPTRGVAGVVVAKLRVGDRLAAHDFWKPSSELDDRRFVVVENPDSVRSRTLLEVAYGEPSNGGTVVRRVEELINSESTCSSG